MSTRGISHAQALALKDRLIDALDVVDLIVHETGKPNDLYVAAAAVALGKELHPPYDETKDFNGHGARYTLKLARAALSAIPEPNTREELLEEVAQSLEDELEWGGAYGQKQRKPTGFAKAAAHVRAMK